MNSADYKNENLWLMQGDCLQRLKEIPDASVNLVLTDPPYNISKPNNFATMGRAGIDFGEWDKGFDLFSYISELPRILHKDASLIIFNDWKNLGDIAKCCESNGFIVKDMLRWEKSNPMPRNRDRRYVTDYEVAIWCTNTKAKWTFNRKDTNYQRPLFKTSLTPSTEKVGHSTQKPEKLMDDLVYIHSNEGDTVLDLFQGSGTTGVSCVKSSRKYIGIEKDECYFKIGKERIESALTTSQEIIKLKEELNETH